MLLPRAKCRQSGGPRCSAFTMYDILRTVTEIFDEVKMRNHLIIHKTPP